MNPEQEKTPTQTDGPTLDERLNSQNEPLNLEDLVVPGKEDSNFPLADRGLGPEAYLGEKL